MDNSEKPEVLETPIPPKPPENKPSKKQAPSKRSRLKSVIIWGEFFIIFVLLIAIVITAFRQNRILKESLSQMSDEQASLSQELSRLTDSLEKMQQIQEALVRHSADETILTYDDTGTEVHIPILAGVPRHNYDFKSLQDKDGFKNYIVDNQVASFRGIDVSSFQGNINWQQVKEAGVDFAMIRLGYRGYGTGAILLDDYFEANIKGATAAGIEVGVYFFSQAISEEEALEEANFVIEHLKGYNINYPVAYDMEAIPHDTARTDNLTGRQITDHTIAFCEAVKAAGYKPSVYSNRRWLVLKLDLTKLTAYDTWYASYVSYPDYPYNFTMWQFTDSGSVPGITGDVDINISFKDYTKE